VVTVPSGGHSERNSFIHRRPEGGKVAFPGFQNAAYAAFDTDSGPCKNTRYRNRGEILQYSFEVQRIIFCTASEGIALSGIAFIG
jgi:hypothetical protein